MTQFYAFIIATNHNGEKVMNSVRTTMGQGFATEKLAIGKMKKHIKNNFAQENVILAEVKEFANNQEACDHSEALKASM